MVNVHWDNRIYTGMLSGLWIFVLANFKLFYLPNRKQSKLFLFLISIRWRKQSTQHARSGAETFECIVSFSSESCGKAIDFFFSDRASCFFYVSFPEVKWQWITIISLWLYNKGWGGPLFQWFIGRIFCASKWCKVSFSYVLNKGNYCALVLSIWALIINFDGQLSL